MARVHSIADRDKEIFLLLYSIQTHTLACSAYFKMDIRGKAQSWREADYSFASSVEVKNV
jgi:hypothetical protein